VVAQVMREVAEELGNTPAVARASYVDPRIVDEFHGPWQAPTGR
jgi:DNA topoisomerase IB